MGVKEGKGTGKTMLSPGVVWKCQAWENWLFPSEVYSTRWEVLQRRLISSRVNENYGGATWSRVLEVSLRWRLKTFRSWQLKATVEGVVGQDEVSSKPATLKRKYIQSSGHLKVSSVCAWKLSTRVPFHEPGNMERILSFKENGQYSDGTWIHVIADSACGKSRRPLKILLTNMNSPWKWRSSREEGFSLQSRSCFWKSIRKCQWNRIFFP